MTTQNTSADPALDLTARDGHTLKSYIKSGQPYIWVTAAAITVCFLITVSLLALTAVRGLPHFWPADIAEFTYAEPNAPAAPLMAQWVDEEEVSSARLASAGLAVDPKQLVYTRTLIKVANRDIFGSDYRYIVGEWAGEKKYPTDIIELERAEWGNFIGRIVSLKQDGKVIASDDAAWQAFPALQKRADGLRDQAESLDKEQIGEINYQLDRIRLDRKQLAIEGKTLENAAAAFKTIDAQELALNAKYDALRLQLQAIRKDMARDVLVVKSVDNQTIELSLDKIIRGFRPNEMNLLQKIGMYFEKLWEFVSDDPREANTEGGIYPAIFGTVMMVILMSVFVTPFGILAALYLREYAKQGTVTQIIRIAVNNLAGVPSIVYGMFGLGFFVYFLGANIDEVFFAASLPAPTFGTPGILWSSLTLALLTLPVVIVATEEGLTRIPRALREASLALGATKAETLWKIVLPMASPAMMTGLILAIARAAGEVAPLMLVGVVKLAPSLPLDGNFPFVHFERKFMHLGFHIYDVGFQSPNVEAARPLVYATSFLLVLVIISLNVTAIRIRNSLREKYKALDA